jgi:hypothetical protein
MIGMKRCFVRLIGLFALMGGDLPALALSPTRLRTAENSWVPTWYVLSTSTSTARMRKDTPTPKIAVIALARGGATANKVATPDTARVAKMGRPAARYRPPHSRFDPAGYWVIRTATTNIVATHARRR